jgi:hypothetical protein
LKNNKNKIKESVEQKLKPNVDDNNNNHKKIKD